MTAIEQRRVTAIHEAGHAVIARRLGVNVAIAALFPPNSMVGGGVEAESQISKTNGLSTEAAEIDIKVALAGIAAQRRAFPDSVGDKDGKEDCGIIQDGVARIVYIMNGLMLPDDGAASHSAMKCATLPTAFTNSSPPRPTPSSPSAGRRSSASPRP